MAVGSWEYVFALGTDSLTPSLICALVAYLWCLPACVPTASTLIASGCRACLGRSSRRGWARPLQRAPLATTIAHRARSVCLALSARRRRPTPRVSFTNRPQTSRRARRPPPARARRRLETAPCSPTGLGAAPATIATMTDTGRPSGTGEAIVVTAVAVAVAAEEETGTAAIIAKAAMTPATDSTGSWGAGGATTAAARGADTTRLGLVVDAQRSVLQ